MMNEHENFSPITAEVNSLREALTDPNQGAQYLHELSVQMQEAASVTDLDKLSHPYDLLMRNLVVAADNVGDRAVEDAIGDVHKEVTAGARSLLGYDWMENQAEDAAAPMKAIRQLQSEFNSATELNPKVDPIIRTGMIDALMFAQARLLTSPAAEQGIFRYTDKNYYLENIAAAKLRLDVHQ